NEKNLRESLPPQQHLSRLCREFCSRFPIHSDAIERQFELERIIIELPEDDLPTPNDDADPLDGEYKDRPKFDRYEIREEIGSGGAGVVFKAEERFIEGDPSHRRTVAMKMLQAYGLPAIDNKVLHAEALKIATLRHASVIAVYGVGT